MSAAQDAPVLGVDVGGTKVAAGCLGDAGIEGRVELPTHHTSAEAVIADIEAAVEAVIDACGSPAAVGIGLPSQIDRSGRVVSSVNIPLAGVALADTLRERLGAPVFIDNDANCAALGEAHAPGAEATHDLVMYTLGTGVGGGVVIGGRIFRGFSGLGGELGHAVVQADGPECPGACPNRGCLEALCSGTALERDASALAAERPGSRLAGAADDEGRVHGRAVVAAARDGDADAGELMSAFGRWLGIGISNAINVFEPERVIVGGGLSSAADLFFERAVAEARSRALPALAERVEIGLARGGPDAGLIGAALLARHELEAGHGDLTRAGTGEGAR